MPDYRLNSSEVLYPSIKTYYMPFVLFYNHGNIELTDINNDKFYATWWKVF